MPINGYLIVIVLILYFFNNAVFKVSFEGMAGIFFNGYFNDLICPLFFLSYANILLITVNRGLFTFLKILILISVSGIIWEVFAPFLKENSVTDILDFCCYIIGAILYYLLIRIR